MKGYFNYQLHSYFKLTGCLTFLKLVLKFDKWIAQLGTILTFGEKNKDLQSIN